MKNLPIKKYSINLTEHQIITHDHCKEGCDLCTQEITRYEVFWKDSKVTQFQIPTEHEWEVTHAISQILKGL